MIGPQKPLRRDPSGAAHARTQTMMGVCKVVVSSTICTAILVFAARLVIFELHWLQAVASLMAICLIRWRWHTGADRSLPAVIRQELCDIVDDWSAAPRCCFRARHLSTQAIALDLYAAASSLPKYSFYGLINPWRLMVGPIDNLQECWTIIKAWCGSIHKVQVMQAERGVQLMTGPVMWGCGSF